MKPERRFQRVGVAAVSSAHDPRDSQTTLPTSAAARRRVLRGLAALAGAMLAPDGWTQSPGVTPARATAMQRSLLGFAYSDVTLTNALLQALAASVGARPLAQVAQLASATPPAQLEAALRGANLSDVATTILVAFASGVVTTAQGPVVITYTEALAWQMVPWTKPNAYCGGLTDYWASAPAGPK